VTESETSQIATSAAAIVSGSVGIADLAANGVGLAPTTSGL
jgi:hypothetical protein